MYDNLIVGAGLFGFVFAHEMTARGKKPCCRQAFTCRRKLLYRATRGNKRS